MCIELKGNETDPHRTQKQFQTRPGDNKSSRIPASWTHQLNMPTAQPRATPHALGHQLSKNVVCDQWAQTGATRNEVVSTGTTKRNKRNCDCFYTSTCRRTTLLCPQAAIKRSPYTCTAWFRMLCSQESDRHHD